MTIETPIGTLTGLRAVGACRESGEVHQCETDKRQRFGCLNGEGYELRRGLRAAIGAGERGDERDTPMSPVVKADAKAICENGTP